MLLHAVGGRFVKSVVKNQKIKSTTQLKADSQAPLDWSKPLVRHSNLWTRIENRDTPTLNALLPTPRRPAPADFVSAVLFHFYKIYINK